MSSADERGSATEMLIQNKKIVGSCSGYPIMRRGQVNPSARQGFPIRIHLMLFVAKTNVIAISIRVDGQNSHLLTWRALHLCQSAASLTLRSKIRDGGRAKAHHYRPAEFISAHMLTYFNLCTRWNAYILNLRYLEKVDTLLQHIVLLSNAPTTWRQRPRPGTQPERSTKRRAYELTIVSHIRNDDMSWNFWKIVFWFPDALTCHQNTQSHIGSHLTSACVWVTPLKHIAMVVADPSQDRELLQRFEVQKFLGKGSYGSVYVPEIVFWVRNLTLLPNALKCTGYMDFAHNSRYMIACHRRLFGASPIILVPISKSPCRLSPQAGLSCRSNRTGKNRVRIFSRGLFSCGAGFEFAAYQTTRYMHWKRRTSSTCPL